MNDLELQTLEIQNVLSGRFCELAFSKLYSMEAQAQAYERYPEAREWWSIRLASDNRRWDYVEGAWAELHALLEMRSAARAGDEVLASCGMAPTPRP